MCKKLSIFLLLILGVVVADTYDSKYFFTEEMGYKKISKETVDFILKELNYPSKLQQFEKYNYLFQKDPLDTVFTRPFIQVQINENGRLSIGEIKRLGKEAFEYDPRTHYLWGKNSPDISVIIPTNYGTINVYFYPSQKELQNDSIEFRNFVNSIVLSSKIKYSSGFIQNTPIIKELAEGIENNFFLVIVLVILFLFNMAIRKFRKVT